MAETNGNFQGPTKQLSVRLLGGSSFRSQFALFAIVYCPQLPNRHAGLPLYSMVHTCSGIRCKPTARSVSVFERIQFDWNFGFYPAATTSLFNWNANALHYQRALGNFDRVTSAAKLSESGNDNQLLNPRKLRGQSVYTVFRGFRTGFRIVEIVSTSLLSLSTLSLFSSLFDIPRHLLNLSSPFRFILYNNYSLLPSNWYLNQSLAPLSPYSYLSPLSSLFPISCSCMHSLISYYSSPYYPF